MLLLTPSAAAEYLRLSKSSLAKMRISGRGPEFRKHGRSVVYDQSALERWSDQFIRMNTMTGRTYRVCPLKAAHERLSAERTAQKVAEENARNGHLPEPQNQFPVIP